MNKSVQHVLCLDSVACVRKYLDHYCVTKGHGAKSQVYKPDSQGSKEVTLVD